MQTSNESPQTGNGTSVEAAQTLPDLGILAKLQPSDRKILAQAGDFQVLSERSYFATQGEPQDAMAIILEGKVVVSCRARGEIIELARLGPGEIIGEMSIIDPQGASADVRVIDGTARLWVLTAAGFESFVDGHADIGFQFLKAIASRLCQRIRRNSDVMLRQSEQTRHRFLDLDY